MTWAADGERLINETIRCLLRQTKMGSPKSPVPFDMVIIRQQVNPGLDARQIRSSQRMGCPFICLINSEPLSIFNHQRGNEINNPMVPTAHAHIPAQTKQISIYNFDYEHVYILWNLWFIRKQRFLISFCSSCFAHFVKPPEVAWVHAVPQKSKPVIPQLPIPQTKIYRAGLVHATALPPHGSAPPLLSLTCIAST